MLILFFKALFVGLAVSVPVGPLGVFCLNRLLTYGIFTGVVAGLGVATADAIFGAVSAIGVTYLADWLHEHQHMIQRVGGFLLLAVGTLLFFKRLHTEITLSARHHYSAYATTLALALMNPVTIVLFTFYFAILGVGQEPSYLGLLIVVIGVFLGSAFWWVLLGTLVYVFNHRLKASFLPWMNKVAGLAIALFGLAALLLPNV